MSATATSITDVLPVRPATTTASSEPGAAPAVDFGAMVAQLQGAAQPAAVAGASAAPESVPDAVPADAAASAAPALPASGVLSLAAGASVPAPLVPGALTSAESGTAAVSASSPADQSRPLGELGVADEGEGESAHETVGAPRRRQGERAVDEGDEPTSGDAGVAAVVVPTAAMLGLVMPLPVPVSVSAPAADRASSAPGSSSQPDVAPVPGAQSASSAAIASQALSAAGSQPSALDVTSMADAARSELAAAQTASAAPAAFASAPSAAATTTDGRPVQEAERGAAAGAGVAATDPESGDAAARPAAAPAQRSARDASTVIQSEVGSLRSAFSTSPDPVLTASRDAVPAARRLRVEASRDVAARDAVSPAPERGEGSTMPAETGVMSFDTSMSAARAMAADEPGHADEVRTPAFEQVAARLRELRTDGRHEITMRLDPADLGGLTIDARLEGTRLTVHIRAEHGATQELLNDTLPRLRESLAQQGFVPEQLSVQLGFDGSGAWGGGAAHDRARSFNAPNPPGSPAPAPARTPRVSGPTTVSGTRGGLDLWA